MDERASALKVGKWLRDKGRKDEAVALLSAWAAAGPNDPEGQGLLAEALRTDPGSPLAKMAFERMEGLAGDHAALDEAIGRFGSAQLKKLQQEMAQPTFRRAQMGHNNNVLYKKQYFHIQTEDSGLDKPWVITHLFAQGGRIIKSHKRSYANEVARQDVAQYVKELMKGQQMEMTQLLRSGAFDAVIAGKAMGGIEQLDYPPRVEVQQLATKKDVKVNAAAPASRSAPPPPMSMKPTAKVVHFRLEVLRALSGGPPVYEPPGEEITIGSSGQITLPGEKFCHPREAILMWRAGRLWLRDLDGGNGVFLKVHHLCELQIGDEFIIGDQLLRVEGNPEAMDGPDPGPTYFYPAPNWISPFRVVQLFEGGAPGACCVARGTTMQIGSAIGDMVLSGDPLVAEQHCLVEENAGVIVLTDLGSRTGVFVRIKGEQELVDGDELLLGRTRLKVIVPE
jgi:hypothetical protein